MKKQLKIWILLWAAFVSWQGQAQFKESPPQNLPFFDDVFWHWGYYFGFNIFDFKVDYAVPENTVRSVPEYGFNVGLISDFRLGRMWNLRLEPGIYTANRTLYFLHIHDKYDSIRRVKSNYISLPVYLKFNALRNGNMRPFVAAGLSYNYNLTSYQNSGNDNAGGKFRMKTHVYMAHIAFGWEMYMYYFKFTPSIHGVFALNNEMVPDRDPNSPWTGPLEGIRTRGVYIVLTFE